jgi:alpha-tubulin suppressor-like RCC1 family protein
VLLVALGLSGSANQAMGEQAGANVPNGDGGALDAGGAFSCAILSARQMRCWGFGSAGRLGYGGTTNIGDNETPDSAGPVNLGAGRTATSIATGNGYTCAILDTGQVRCWGYDSRGELGYGNTNNIGDNESPASVGTVDLGPGRTATAITAGDGQTCAILDTGQVLCWGYALNGQLGYGNVNDIGDNETPASAGPVNLGTGRTAVAISAGDYHTCAILDTGAVRCWGDGADGRLGYGNTTTIGDDETPDTVGPVDLGAGRTAVAISAGGAHTCVILDTHQVMCWGSGLNGQLGYGNANSIGDDETPASTGPVNLGPGRTAVAISAGRLHTCAIVDTGQVLCWGSGSDGRLGYGNTRSVGDDEVPASVGPVGLGSGRTALAIAAGGSHTCAALDTGQLRCWGDGTDGQLGYGNTNDIGDNETPDSVAPVKLGASFVDATTSAPPDSGSPGGNPNPTKPPLDLGPGDAQVKQPPLHRSKLRKAVGAFTVAFNARPLVVGDGGQLIGRQDLGGVIAGSTVNIRCLRACRLDRTVRITKVRHGILLPRPVDVAPLSLVRVTVSHPGEIARDRTYYFRRTTDRLTRRLSKTYPPRCASDVRGRRAVLCPASTKRRT